MKIYISLVCVCDARYCVASHLAVVVQEDKQTRERAFNKSNTKHTSLAILADLNPFVIFRVQLLL